MLLEPYKIPIRLCKTLLQHVGTLLDIQTPTLDNCRMIQPENVIHTPYTILCKYQQQLIPHFSLIFVNGVFRLEKNFFFFERIEDNDI